TVIASLGFGRERLPLQTKTGAEEMAAAGPQQPPGRAQRLERRHEGSDKQRHLALRDLYAGLYGSGARTGLQFARRPAGGLRGLYKEPGARGLATDPRSLRRWRLFRRVDGPAGAAEASSRHAGQTDRRDRRL